MDTLQTHNGYDQDKTIPSEKEGGWPGLPLTQQGLVINAQPFVSLTVGRRLANNVVAHNAASRGKLMLTAILLHSISAEKGEVMNCLLRQLEKRKKKEKRGAVPLFIQPSERFAVVVLFSSGSEPRTVFFRILRVSFQSCWFFCGDKML